MNKGRSLEIVLLEGSQQEADQVADELSKSNLPFSLKHFASADEFSVILKDAPDVILCDHDSSNNISFASIDLCSRLLPAVPFILVTNALTDDLTNSYMKRGADDYVLKSNLEQLPLAIRRMTKLSRLQTLKRRALRSLQTQNTKLEKVNKELDSLVYSLSHELRGPLTSVLGLLNIARLEDEPGQFRSIHTMIEKSIDKLDLTLQEIVDFSRNARSEVNVTLINWEHTMAKTIAKLAGLENRSKVHITWEQNGVPFYSDERRIRSILMNLITNGIVFMNDKGIRPELTIQINSYSDHVQIVVEDNGIGINDRHLSRVFEMFFRGAESRGAGLGLYITKEIISILNGQIELSSKEHHGTNVKVTLPNAASQS